ncbi:TenA family protein [Campylobacter corcagiensis]|uniref:TenA family protein n=1 Tax=Campylobacter corcagiensis TaxID=1448857 RepID=A0A7M1LIY1_9BACT|nr:TenA family protein [Campylobacter corcagiensis]QKF64346.1 thiaminase II [Campylobacter corcagiensis]QOQ87465.1 TenA family protein [Campylobacter corcagiensis]
MTLQGLIDKNIDVWDKFIHHEFINLIKTSKLSQDAFKDYLIQDYLFLRHFSRFFALAMYKSRDFEDMNFFFNLLENLVNLEIFHHINYCDEAGVSIDDMDKTDEGVGTIAYSRYLIDVANTYSIPEILVATAPYSIGLYDIAQELSKTSSAYKSWIDMHKNESFINTARKIEQFLNEKIADISYESEDGKVLNKVFRNACIAEAGMFTQSMERFQPKSLFSRIFGK